MGTLGSFCPNVRFTSDVVMCLRERIHLFEEPDALIALVRVCGGVGGDPAGTTRQNDGCLSRIVANVIEVNRYCPTAASPQPKELMGIEPRMTQRGGAATRKPGKAWPQKTQKAQKRGGLFLRVFVLFVAILPWKVPRGTRGFCGIVVQRPNAA